MFLKNGEDFPRERSEWGSGKSCQSERRATREATKNMAFVMVRGQDWVTGTEAGDATWWQLVI